MEETYPLKDLFPPNIRQPSIQIPDLARHLVHLALILTLDLTRLPDRDVKRQPDRSRPSVSAEPTATGGGAGGRETEAVETRVGGGEGEFVGRVDGLGGRVVGGGL